MSELITVPPKFFLTTCDSKLIEKLTRPNTRKGLRIIHLFGGKWTIQSWKRPASDTDPSFLFEFVGIIQKLSELPRQADSKPESRAPFERVLHMLLDMGLPMVKAELLALQAVMLAGPGGRLEAGP